MSRRRALIAIVAAGALLRLLHLATILPTAYPRLPEEYAASDMAAYVEWAGEIQAGDVLGRDTYHPDFDWMAKLGSRADWTRWWGSWEVFHQAPLYPYLLAVLLLGGVPFTLLVQLCLGALQPLLAYRLTEVLAGRRAGLIAAALTAFYVPFVVHQAVLLRDWIPPLLEPLAVLLLLEGHSRRRPGRYALAGLTLGLAFLTKPTVALFLPCVLLWLAVTEAGHPKRTTRAACWILLGGTLALQPLIVRNLAVGAPPLAVSNRFLEAFVVGNARGSQPVGYVVPPSQSELLEQARGDKLKLVQVTLATWDGDWVGFLHHQVQKLRGALGPYEVANNVDVYYARQHSPILWLGLGFGGVLAPGLLGVWWTLRNEWRRRFLVLLWLLAGLGSLTLPNAIGRYRLGFVQAVIVFAGIGLAWLTRRLRAGGGASPLLALAAGYGIHLLVLPVDGIWSKLGVVANPAEYAAAVTVYLNEQDYETAMREVDRYEVRLAGLPEIPAAAADEALRSLRGSAELVWARDLLGAGDLPAAWGHAEQARLAFTPPTSPELLVLLARLQTDLNLAPAARATWSRVEASGDRDQRREAQAALRDLGG
jgi:hypothetical protein